MTGPLRHTIFPAHFPPPAYDFAGKPLEQEKIELGRALFYDPVLSSDSTISCASCHSPYNSFSHTDHDLSHGIRDQIGTRNAPALFNLAWQSEFMWDGRINHLDMLPLAPISDTTEMDEDIAHIVQKLQRGSIYPPLFAAAWGDPASDSDRITGQRVLLALAQFQLSLVSANAKYDSVQRGESAFTAQEVAGYQLYQQHCSTCHAEPLFSTYQFASNGLPPDSTLNDLGLRKSTGKDTDRYLFKIPSLRNLSYTYPYMHDGRFKRLSQVLNHYTDGIPADHEYAAEALRGGLPLSKEDKADMIAFLLTLNDPSFVFDPKHQFPKNVFFPGAEN
jgi:cytochrome c peroxidase